MLTGAAEQGRVPEDKGEGQPKPKSGRSALSLSETDNVADSEQENGDEVSRTATYRITTRNVPDTAMERDSRD
jgi:hypothetical protein